MVAMNTISGETVSVTNLKANEAAASAG